MPDQAFPRRHRGGEGDRARRTAPRWSVGLLAVTLAAGGCVIPPAADAPDPAVQIVGADARALRFGASAGEILTHPQLRDRFPLLFAADWGPAPGGPPTALRAPVTEFFARTEALRLLRVGTQTYVAVSGCPAAGCAGRRGLILIREDAVEILARLDEGGLSHYYVQGPGAGATPLARALLDSAWWTMRATAHRAPPPGES